MITLFCPVAATQPKQKCMKQHSSILDVDFNPCKYYKDIVDYLSNNNKQFIVVGIVGCHGTGKSTIASLLANSNDYPTIL